MPTPVESGLLNLQLFELRREPVLREARSRFLGEFNPQSLSELIMLASGDRNASFRVVLDDDLRLPTPESIRSWGPEAKG